MISKSTEKEEERNKTGIPTFFLDFYMQRSKKIIFHCERILYTLNYQLLGGRGCFFGIFEE